MLQLSVLSNYSMSLFDLKKTGTLDLTHIYFNGHGRFLCFVSSQCSFVIYIITSHLSEKEKMFKNIIKMANKILKQQQ